MRAYFLWAVLAAVFAVPSFVWASPTVTLNGVDVTGVKNQRLTNVTVEFDGSGNIVLTAPQYRIVEQSSSGPVPPSATRPAEFVASADTVVPSAGNAGLARLPDDGNPTYVLALFNAPGLLGYNVDVLVNGQFVKTLVQGQSQQTCDISRYLVKGSENSIQYRMVMAADSGTSSKATVCLSLAKATHAQGAAVELTGEYAPIVIRGLDGAKTYTVTFIVP